MTGKTFPSKRRDESISYTCAWCGGTFHPWAVDVKTGRVPRFCSRLCSSRGGLAQVNGASEVVPVPVRATDPAVVLVGSTAISVADTESGETVLKLASKLRSTKREAAAA